MIEFQEGEEVWLHPDKGHPELRHRCRITRVRRYGAYGQTVLYDTDHAWTAEPSQWNPAPTEQPAKGLSGHWLAPISAVDRLAALTPGRTAV